MLAAAAGNGELSRLGWGLENPKGHSSSWNKKLIATIPANELKEGYRLKREHVLGLHST